MHVAIDARIPSGGRAGGVEQFIIGLARALFSLDQVDRYTLLSRRDLASAIGSSKGVSFLDLWSAQERIKSLLGPLRLYLGKARMQARLRQGHGVEVANESPLFARIGADLVHIPHQAFFRTNLPCVYSPHDLQHLHYPEMFDKVELARRTSVYEAGCLEARVVTAGSKWVRRDIIERYNVPSESVVYVPHGPTTILFPEPSKEDRANLDELKLPNPFILYPAQPWPHKNHERLIEAVSVLARSGTKVHLVCTGGPNPRWSILKEAALRHGVSDRLILLGYVSPSLLRLLYRAAKALVFPSFFEGGGLPILDAFAEGTPVACARATSLTEYAGAAARTFDPFDIEEICLAIKDVLTDEGLRILLTTRGRERVELFDWRSAAERYLAVYRLAAGVGLNAKDKGLIRMGQEDSG